MAVITVWSDLLCPWGYITALRLHRTRDRERADSLEFDFRACPRELAEGGAPSEPIVRNEMAVLAQLETTAFSSFDGAWPASSLPAFEAQKWAYAMGQEVGEAFDLALRRALFLHSRDISRRGDLLEVASAEGLPAGELAGALDAGRFRQAVVADFHAAAERGVVETPVVELGDGTTHLNPGITHRVVRDIPIIQSDHPGVYDDLLRAALSDD